MKITKKFLLTNMILSGFKINITWDFMTQNLICSRVRIKRNSGYIWKNSKDSMEDMLDGMKTLNSKYVS